MESDEIDVIEYEAARSIDATQFAVLERPPLWRREAMLNPFKEPPIGVIAHAYGPSGVEPIGVVPHPESWTPPAFVPTTPRVLQRA